MTNDLTSLTGSTRFEAMTREITQLRAAAANANSRSVPAERTPKPDVAAVEQRISALTGETTPKETPVTNEITKVGGDVPQPRKLERIGVRFYTSIDRGDEYMRGSRNGNSWFLDLAKAAHNEEARQRLVKNERQREEFERRAGLTTVNGAGGEFSPPLWLESDFVELARPGRVLADLCTGLPLPTGTDTINIPKINTGTAVAAQASQNTGVQETDLTTTSVASPVYTISGGQTVSLQLIEQSPLDIDSVILEDLARAYAGYLNNTVLAGTGTGGQPTGIQVQTGTHAVSYSAAQLTGTTGAYAAIVNAVAAIQTTRYDRPDAIVMNPITWAFFLLQEDTQNRPLIVPFNAGQMNAFGVQAITPPAEGMVGWIAGLPVYLDSAVPSADGVILVGKFSDCYLWESVPRLEAFQQTYAQNLAVYLRFYNYMGFTAGRYPQSLAVITGPSGA